MNHEHRIWRQVRSVNARYFYELMTHLIQVNSITTCVASSGCGGTSLHCTVLHCSLLTPSVAWVSCSPRPARVIKGEFIRRPHKRGLPVNKPGHHRHRLFPPGHQPLQGSPGLWFSLAKQTGISL